MSKMKNIIFAFSLFLAFNFSVFSQTEAPIAPGAKGEIQVKYDTNRVGPIRKTITVNSNARDTPVVSLKIKGTVQPSLK